MLRVPSIPVAKKEKNLLNQLSRKKILPQLPLQFESELDFAAENFITSPSNYEVVKWLEKWPKWPSHALIISGSKGCGKTHLAHIWQAKSQGEFIDVGNVANMAEIHHAIIENIENIKDQKKLLHIFNHVKEVGGFLLMTTGLKLSEISFSLPDLESRIKSSQYTRISQPDDELLKAMLVKNFSDRQLKISNEVLAFLLPRIKRSASGVAEIVAKLDKSSLKHKRNITIPFVKENL